MKIRTLGATAALVLLLGACGADDSAASKAIADSIMDSGNESFEVTQEQADCVGDGMVDGIGTDNLVEYGIITEENEAGDGIDSVEMSEDDANAAADVMQECADIEEILSEAFAELPEEAKTCIDEKLTDEVLHDFLVAVFQDDQEAGTQGLTAAMTECMAVGG